MNSCFAAPLSPWKRTCSLFVQHKRGAKPQNAMHVSLEQQRLLLLRQEHKDNSRRLEGKKEATACIEHIILCTRLKKKKKLTIPRPNPSSIRSAMHHKKIKRKFAACSTLSTGFLSFLLFFPLCLLITLKCIRKEESEAFIA